MRVLCVFVRVVGFCSRSWKQVGSGIVPLVSFCLRVFMERGFVGSSVGVDLSLLVLMM